MAATTCPHQMAHLSHARAQLFPPPPRVGEFRIVAASYHCHARHQAHADNRTHLGSQISSDCFRSVVPPCPPLLPKHLRFGTQGFQAFIVEGNWVLEEATGNAVIRPLASSVPGSRIWVRNGGVSGNIGIVTSCQYLQLACQFTPKAAHSRPALLAMRRRAIASGSLSEAGHAELSEDGADGLVPMNRLCFALCSSHGWLPRVGCFRICE